MKYRRGVPSVQSVDGWQECPSAHEEELALASGTIYVGRKHGLLLDRNRYPIKKSLEIDYSRSKTTGYPANFILT